MGKFRFIAAVASVVGISACGLAPQLSSESANSLSANKTGRWWAVQFHSHSSLGGDDGKNTISELIKMAKSQKIDALAISEHDTLKHFETREWQQEKQLTMIHAFEWTSETGHAGIHGPMLASWGSTIPKTIPNAEMIAEASSRGATIIIHHPRMPASNYWRSGYDRRVSAIEVWSNWYYVVNNTPEAQRQAPFTAESDKEAEMFNSRAIRWWNSLLKAGYRVPIAASSDYHRWPQKLSSPCTLVYAPDKSEESLLAALRAGRTVGVKEPDSARIFLDADLDGNGSFESMVGDSAKATRSEVRLRLRVTKGKNMKLSLHTVSGEFLTVQVPTNNWETTVTVPADKRYAWARLDGKVTELKLQSITGAVYFDGR